MVADPCEDSAILAAINTLTFVCWSVDLGFLTMSIAMERSSGCGGKSNRQRSGFMRPPCAAALGSGDRRVEVVERWRKQEEKEDVEGGSRGSSSSSSSSSIGRDSDESGGEAEEVQSKGPFDSMDALEEALPIKRGISKFYNGKSKSFTSLADASSASSIHDLAKPENPYNRKRKNNLLSVSNFRDKSWSDPRKNSGSCIPKRPASSNRNLTSLGMMTSCSGSSNDREDSRSMSSCLPPLHPQRKKTPSNASWSPPPRRDPHCRSFSLSDLQCAATAAAASNS